jgi:hypothetical protein
MSKCDKCIHDGVCSLKEKYNGLVERLKNEFDFSEQNEPFNIVVDCRKYTNKVQCYPYSPYYYQQQQCYPYPVTCNQYKYI